MTVEEVKILCPKAENISIMDSTVGMKVGDFAMARNIDLSQAPGNAERQIKDLYLDLQAMNREQDSQRAEANMLHNKRSS
jgi:hypothetical protein